MRSFPRFSSSRLLAVFALTLTLLLSGSAWQAQAQGGTPGSPLVQRFQDVPDTYLFAPFINSLYDNGIVGGYPCGGNNPCVPPANLPYFLPSDNVTRGQLAKFLDNGRQKIGNAIGNSLVITTSNFVALSVSNSSGGYAVRGSCITAGTGCYAVSSSAATGSFAGVFEGGKGVFASAADTDRPAVYASSTGGGGWGVYGLSTSSRGVQAKTGASASYSLWVEPAGGVASTAAAYIGGGLFVSGDLNVSGSKTGYVVDIMQNVGSEPLSQGDIVVIVGSSAPAQGSVPVITVRKATRAYDIGVVGVVDAAVNVPSSELKAHYAAEQAAIKAALARRDATELAAKQSGQMAAAVTIPQQTISDKAVAVEAQADAAGVATGGYINAVTLGSYKSVKVDASFGPIKAGDLLVASTNPGYAMKADPDGKTSGAVIGKALGDLNSGTGAIPVIVTLK